MTTPHRQPVDGLPTAELLKVFHGSLMAQQEAAEDQLQYIAKSRQVLTELRARFDGDKVAAAVGESAEISKERDLRAQLTRENARLREQLRRLTNQPRRRDTFKPTKQADPDAPWLAYRCRPGEGRPGQPPYGYRFANGQLEPVEYEQRVIARIRDSRQLSPPGAWWAIAKQLNREGFRTRRGNPFKPIGLHLLWVRVVDQEDEITPLIVKP